MAEVGEPSPLSRLVPRKRGKLNRHVSESSTLMRLPSKLMASQSSPVLRRNTERRPSEASKNGSRMFPAGQLPPISPGAASASPAKSSSSSSLVPDALPAVVDPMVDLGTQAITLSKRHKLDVLEIKPVLLALQKVKPDREHGGMSLPVFREFLLAALGTKEARDELVTGAHAECNADHGRLDVDKFLHWYKANMFSIVSQLTACSQKKESDDLILQVSQKFNLRVVEVDAIHQQFARFDTDNSGELDYEEFEGMMRTLLGVSNSTDLPKERMNRFWKEIDKDGSGGVTFEEFTEWYLKYFSSNNPHGGVLEAFYASYSPDVQRSKGLEYDSEEGQSSILRLMPIPQRLARRSSTIQ
eukprot:TRINITY_DN18139_c0_g1_i1.p1 TRINITY_DN18139_c0_g1~~TRINITY_DN18139_c0_g1_i1.p1  ORF type:complete len:368 (+),score=77.06 TRINITY_DN18139_c0_g1_i1:36-1106(+)